MSAPHFDTWSNENLAKFAKEAYEKLQRQDEELQSLRLQNTELDAKLAQLEKNHVG